MNDKPKEVLNNEKNKRYAPLRIFLVITFAFCLIIAGLLLFFSKGRPGSDLRSYDENVLTVSEGWLLTDSSGGSKEIELPYTIPYGNDGKYTLVGVLPEFDSVIGTPALCFYSNYIDFSIIIGGETVFTFPDSDVTSQGATGNTYNYMRLASDSAGKEIRIEIYCQLGDDITYLLKAPQIGAKASMLYDSIMISLPSIIIGGSMIVLALVLMVFHFMLREKLNLNTDIAYTSLFAIVFAVYIYCETDFAQHISTNGYALCSVTLMLLALIPIPLYGLFAGDIGDGLKHVPPIMMALCFVNLLVQIILNYAGIITFRAMLPATHVSIVITIAAMFICLVLTERKKKKGARKKYLVALPMIIGGMVDIFLLTINKPSFNNSLYFTIGVTLFILIQFISFSRGIFDLYRDSLETEVLRDIAYRDLLTGVGNRNAYELKLEELRLLISLKTLPKMSGFIVDINDMKLINDRYGHDIGDAAIIETGNLLKECLPEKSSCFRTGGDEFIAFVEDCDSESAKALADKLMEEAEKRGKQKSIPLSIAVGSEYFDSEREADIMNFIRQIDSDMYSKKRESKSEPTYIFNDAIKIDIKEDESASRA